jgi:hypothetical protein
MRNIEAKKSAQRMQLVTETVRALHLPELQLVAGGAAVPHVKPWATKNCP